MKYKFIIFDLFGTLADDSEVILKGKDLKEKLTEQQSLIFIAYWRFWHRTSWAHEEFIANLKNTGKFDDTDIKNIETRVDLNQFSLFDDVEGSLQKIKNTGLKMAAISNAPPIARVISSKDKVLPNFLEKIFWSFEMGCMKPEKLIFEKVVNELGWPKEEILYVGDSVENDFLGPKSAGLDAILIDRHSKFDIGGSIKNLHELLTYLKF